MTRILLLSLLAWFVAACFWGRISARLALAWLWLTRHGDCLCRVGLGRLCGRLEAWVWRG